jgi:hypothetical protein
MSLRVAILILGLSCAAGAQQGAIPASPPQAPAQAELSTLIEKQFGPTFKLEFVREPRTGFKYLNPPKELVEWKAMHFGDLNGDGIEDAVFLALSEAPLVDQGAYGYKVIDPYFSRHGWGDPKVTATFQSEDPRFANQVILVIHGAGVEAWRAETPSAKFAIINVPYKHVMIKKAMVKKKQAQWAIAIVEEDQLTSSIFWERGKYKWQPTGSAN